MKLCHPRRQSGLMQSFAKPDQLPQAPDIMLPQHASLNPLRGIGGQATHPPHHSSAESSEIQLSMREQIILYDLCRSLS